MVRRSQDQAGLPDGPTRRPGRPRLTEPSEQHLRRLEEIVATAVTVFHDKGYTEGTLEDVAANLGLQKASLYHYVSSKAELLHRVFDHAISSALKRLDNLTRVDDPRERLAGLIREQVQIISEEPGLFVVFFDNRPRLDQSYEAQIRAKEQDYLRIFAEAVEAAVAAKGLPAVDGRVAAQALLGMTTWIYKWFNPARDDAGMVADTFVRLILAPRGGAADRDPG